MVTASSAKHTFLIGLLRCHKPK